MPCQAVSRNHTRNLAGIRLPAWGQKAGSAVGAVLDTKNKIKDKASAVRENIRDVPTQTAYALHSAKEKAKAGVSDFKRGVVQEQKRASGWAHGKTATAQTEYC